MLVSSPTSSPIARTTPGCSSQPSRAKAREREADRRAHAQLVEDLRALLLILTSGGGGGGAAAAAAGAGDAAVPATMPAALPAPSPAAGPPALSVQ
jgi:hypothetical protein